MAKASARDVLLHPALAGAALALLAVAVYAPVRSAGFVWDDDVYVTQNATLRTLSGLARIWLVPGSVPQYYPLVHTTFWLEYHLWGLDPVGYHAVNVLLHAASAVLLWRLLVRLRVPGGWTASAVFAVHPVMVESVAWITERKNVLSLALALGSLLSYVRFAGLDTGGPPASRARRAWTYALSLGLFLGGLLSKTVVCSVPAVAAVLIVWKRGRLAVRDVLPLLPFLALGLALAFPTIWLERHRVGAHGAEWSLGPAERIVIAGRALWFYAGKLLWPRPLIFSYPRWTIDARSAAQALAPAAALAVLAVLWLARRRIGLGPLAAALIFAGVLVPALGFFDVFPFRYSFVADHFQYHASIALLVGITAGCAIAARAWGPRGRLVAGILGAAVIAVLAALTVQQIRIYRDVETLWRDTIAKNPGAWQAYSNLASHLADTERFDEAIQIASEGVAVAPQIPETHNTLGAMWMLSAARGGVTAARLERAIEAFEDTLRLEPDYEETLFNLAQALAAAGRPGEAREYFERALEHHPDDVAARIGLARALVSVDQADRAEAQLLEALRLDPASAEAHYELGNLLMRRRAFRDASEHYREAVRLAPGDPTLRADLERARDRASAGERLP
ncbi:MAG TPA: tetratricopeptide repeat protein [Myxococcota bacterium]|nr:tetratricopeptide repeat protein [Myxococcota bacterium]